MSLNLLSRIKNKIKANQNYSKLQNEASIAITQELSMYINKAKSFFEDIHEGMTVENHSEHNINPAYWNILLRDIKNNPENWSGKRALDFGCGCGRNIANLLSIAKWDNVDGCDISRYNAAYAKEFIKNKYPEANCLTWETTGYDISPIEHLEECPQKYDFIMSTITFVHIPSWEIRFNILKSMYDSLNKGGMISISLSDLGDSVGYYDNYYDFPKNCRVESAKYIYNDLKRIGFKNITINNSTTFEDRKWYFAKATKG